MAKCTVLFLRIPQNYKVSLRVRPKSGSTYRLPFLAYSLVTRNALPVGLHPPVDFLAALQSWRPFRVTVQAVTFFRCRPLALEARHGSQRDRILNVRFFAQLFFKRSGD